MFDLARPADNGFRGVNVETYRSGLLGVRAGLKRLPIQGLPGFPFVPGPVGFDVWNDSLIISLNHLYRVPLIGGTATALFPYPSPAITRTSFARGDNKLYSLVDGQLYEHTASTTTPITTPSPLSSFIRWGFFMVGIDRNVPWRLWFSSVTASGPNFSSWPATNFIDIANNEPITALAPLYNTLFVGKASGWFAVTGVLGVAASVREVVLGNGPIDQRFTSITTDNRVIYWPLERVPAWWNGERVYLDEMFELAPRNLPYLTDGVIVTPTARRLILASENDTDITELLTWKNSAWTRHRVPFALSGLTPADVRAGYQMPDGVIYGVRRPAVVGEQPVVVTWSHDLDRPGHASDTYASPFDENTTIPVTGSVELPDWFDGQGRQMRVRSLIVQFRKWASGVTDLSNRFEVRVDALGSYDAGPEEGRTHEWIEDSNRASSDGTDDSFRVNVGDQGHGNGFRVTFPMMRGIAIREVIAVCDVRGARVG